MTDLLTYQIPLANLVRLEERLGELNRRARRLRIQESQIAVVGEPFTKTVLRGVNGGPEKKVEVVFTTISMTGGEPVTLDGWAFVATLHHEGPGATLVAMVPGEELPKEYRWATNDCDHCHTSRRRNSTFIVRNPDGELKQVGSGCLADYLPRTGRDPKVMAKYAEWLGAWSVAVGELSDDEFTNLPRSERVWSLECWAEATALIIRKCGWVSKGKARESHDLIATADHVMDWIDPWDARLKEWATEIGPVTAADSETAQAAIEWAEEALLDDSPDLSDYLHNLSVVVRLGYVRQKHLGLAASLLVAHGFATRKAAAETKRAEEGKASRHLATVKDRIRLHGVKVVFTRVMPDRGWGESLMVKLVDRNGNRLVWFSSGSGPDLEEGWVIDLKGTVKAHSNYQGTMETALTRVVWCFGEGQEDAQAELQVSWSQVAATYAEGVGKGKVALDDGREVEGG